MDNSLYIRCHGCKRDITISNQNIVDSNVWCDECLEDEYEDYDDED